MSELKAYKNIQPVYNTAIQKDAVAAEDYDGNEILFEECDEIYFKSEADKVIAELKEERRWRKFPDEKPKEKQWILVYYGYENNGCRIELRRWDNGCKYDVEFQELYTHWMPLPSAPKEEA